MRIKKAKKGVSKTKLKKELDRVFSQYIREKHEKDGKVPCYTCCHIGEVKTMQCGHFVPRQHMSTRWDEDNCRPQCYACNMLYNGQPSTFAVKLDAEKRGTVKRLEKKRHEIRQWTIEELKKEIEKYESH